MVTFGPWTQAPDYTKPAVAHGPPNSNFASAKLTVSEPPPPDPARISEVVLDSRESWGGTGTGTSIDGPLTLDYSGQYGMTPASVYEAARSYGLVTFSAYSQNLNAWAPTVPPDAIGYEWESGAPVGAQRSEVLSLTWDMPSKSFDLDGTTDGPTGGAWTTEVRPVFDLVFASQSSQNQTGVDGVVSWGRDVSGDGNVVKSFPPEPHGATRTDPVDLTPYMFGPPEAGYAAVIREVVLGAAIVPVLDSSNSGTWGIGHAYNLSVPAVYTFRPPRYRLIYPDGATTRRGLPPLRLTQRGDGLTGGAPRLLGRNSQQSTNRLSGGYF